MRSIVVVLTVLVAACGGSDSDSRQLGFVLDDGGIYEKPAEDWNGYYELEWTCTGGDCDDGTPYSASVFVLISSTHALISGIPADEGEEASIVWYQDDGSHTNALTPQADGNYQDNTGDAERFGGSLELYGSPTGFIASETYTQPETGATSDWELVATSVSAPDAGP